MAKKEKEDLGTGAYRVSVLTETEREEEKYPLAVPMETHIAREFTTLASGVPSDLRIISEKTIIKQNLLAQKAMEFPTIPDPNQVIMVERPLVPGHCTNNMDTCPAPCGACLYVENPMSIIGHEHKPGEMLDVQAYLASQKTTRARRWAQSRK